MAIMLIRSGLMRSVRARGWVVLAGVLILAVSILFGLVVFVWSVLAGTGPGKGTGGPPSGLPPVTTSTPSIRSSPSTSAGAVLEAAENALAARAMLEVGPADALPQPMADSTTTSPLILPAATNTTGLVPTGYPRTPAGAVAQLGAIDALAFTDLNPSDPRQAYDWAALPGAVPLQAWTPQVGVSAILSAAGTPDGSGELTSTWTLTHAQVKGVLDDGNFVVACVLGEFDANYRSTVRAGIGDCQRMVWQAGRWWIGPGAQPAFAPSTWPGSPDCVRAGWREVTNA
jgi:hypothetical protein